MPEVVPTATESNWDKNNLKESGHTHE
jgi:hypothetical protein